MLTPASAYSTVCKPRSPRATDPPPAFSSSSLLGGGLSELDHLLQELNATQFNITGQPVCVSLCYMCSDLTFFFTYLTLFLLSDEILAQFPSSKKDERDKIKDKATTPSSRYQIESAQSNLNYPTSLDSILVNDLCCRQLNVEFPGPQIRKD